jgi:hypothetical protein
MRFGTLVMITRGSPGRPAGAPGCLRHVRGVLIGALGWQRRVRLAEDDPHDTVGWRRRGDMGWWSASAVESAERTVCQTIDLESR